MLISRILMRSLHIFIATSCFYSCSNESNFRAAPAAPPAVQDALPNPAAATTPPIEVVNTAPKIVSNPLLLAKVGDPIGTATFYDLRNWVVHDLVPDSTGALASNWSVTERTALQSKNANPTVLLSDLDIKNQKIEGTWKVKQGGDDDFMGFVYAFVDDKTFYLFDWKKGTQNGGNKGMNVKLVKADSALTGLDIWPSVGNGDRVRSLFTNSVPWDYDVVYSFSLNFVPGNTRILVKQDTVVLADIPITDTTLTDGKFGFYNLSQPDISYEGFKRTPVQGEDYRYSVIAEDTEKDELKYILDKSPTGMTIDSKTGVVSWSKANFIVGNHAIVVRVEDKKGLSAKQEYALKVE